ncbi:MAG: FAD-binding oxidoreductase [Flavobacteriales bacterium]
MAAFRNLSIIALDKSVPDNVVIEFAVTGALKEEFKFHPGQFVIVKYVVDGKEYKRSYSISSSSMADVPLQLTVKRVGQGITSNYANNFLKVGDTLDVTTPRGKFCIELNPEIRKTYFLIAAGSGIAPMHSMLQSVLAGEPKSEIRLLYGNRDDDNVIFGKEIMAFAAQHPDRLKVQHVLSRQSKPLNLLKDENIWEGRINEVMLKKYFSPPLPEDYKVFVCGPTEMNLACKEIMGNLALPQDRVHIEFFGKV